MAKYCILKDGTVYNFETKEKVKPCKGNKDYLVVNLNNRSKRLHRLVAKGYIPNPDNKPEVNHIDGNKANNHVSNLEWSTRQENITHAQKTKLSRQAKVSWSNWDQAWLGRIRFEGILHTMRSKDNKQLVEEWLENKRREFYGN